MSIMHGVNNPKSALKMTRITSTKNMPQITDKIIDEIKKLENKLAALRIKRSEKMLSIQNALDSAKNENSLDIVKSKKGPFVIFITETAKASENAIFANLQHRYNNMHYPASKEPLFSDFKWLSKNIRAAGEIIDKDNLPDVYEFDICKHIHYGNRMFPFVIDVMLKAIYWNDGKK